MCLGVPLKIIEIRDNNEALGEMNGIKKSIRIDLVPNVEHGDFVLVHAGFALQKIDAKSAEETMEAFEELKKAAEEF